MIVLTDQPDGLFEIGKKNAAFKSLEGKKGCLSESFNSFSN